MRALLFCTLLGLCACSSMPKLQDLNRISKGMTKEQVIKELGDPASIEQDKDSELLFFNVKDNGQIKPRLVVLKDNEVVFSGKPSQYKTTEETTKQPGIQVNPTISPVFNIGTPHTGATNGPAIDSSSSGQDVASRLDMLNRQYPGVDHQCYSSPIYDLQGRIVRNTLNCY